MPDPEVFAAEEILLPGVDLPIPVPAQAAGRRSGWWLRLAIVVAAIVTLAGTYVWLTSFWMARRTPYLHLHDFVAERSVDVMVAGWTLWVAASIGSFLNVVAYRLPRGKTIQGRSHCPHCDHQLTWRDNVPVIGWILLAGRCRHCDGPISRRYPVVEAAVGVTLAVPILCRLYNVPLPHTDASHWRGNFGGPAIGERLFWTLLIFHVFAIAMVWAMALIRRDGHGLPPRFAIGAIVGLSLVIVAVPDAAVVSWRQMGSELGDPDVIVSRVDAVVRCLTAWVAAAMIGRSLARGISPSADLKLDPLGRGTRRMVDAIAILTLVAIVVGWQSAIAVAVIAAATAVVLQRVIKPTPDPLVIWMLSLPTILAIHLAAWKILHDVAWWPSDHSTPVVVLGWAAMALVLPALFQKPANAAERTIGV